MGKRCTFAGTAFAALLVSAFAAASADAPWRPLRVGDRLVYEGLLQETLPGVERPRRTDRVFTWVEEVAARGSGAPEAASWYEIRTSRRAAGVGGENVRVARTWLASDGGGVREMARSNAERGAPERNAAPLLWVDAAPTVGSRWHVGRLATAEGAIELDAEVTGRTAVDTPAGRFENCLEIHYAGRLETAPREANVPRVTGGTFDGREWLARGIGPVKLVLERALVVEDAAGVRSERTLRETRTLSEREADAERGARGARDARGSGAGASANKEGEQHGDRKESSGARSR